MGDEIEQDWPRNYFNYFTEIEEHFQRVRGSSLFLLSPLDWALIEVWQDSEVPLEAVLRGIDAAFEKWRSKKTKVRQINSLAYCAQAVFEEAQILAGAEPPKPTVETSAPFTESELRSYLETNAALLKTAGFEEAAATVAQLAADAGEQIRKLEELEQRLTALEDKLIAVARAGQTEQDLFEARRDLDHYLKPYRSKMTADQLLMLEKKFLDRRLFEKLGLPRLSLFYLG